MQGIVGEERGREGVKKAPLPLPFPSWTNEFMPLLCLLVWQRGLCPAGGTSCRMQSTPPLSCSCSTNLAIMRGKNMKSSSV